MDTAAVDPACVAPGGRRRSLFDRRFTASNLALSSGGFVPMMRRVAATSTQSDFSGIMWRTQRRGMKVRGVIDPRREDGVAMTEFALILPIFMVIVAGLLGFGRVFFYWIQANHVANETARWAIVDRNPLRPDDTAAACGEQRLRRVRPGTRADDGLHHAERP